MRTLLVLSALLLAPVVHAQSTVLFHDDFESGLSNWTTQTLWHLQASTDPCSNMVGPFPSGTHAAWFGSQQWCAIADPNGWQWFDGYLEQVAPVALPADGSTLRLTFDAASAGEDDEVWDRRTVWMLVDETGPWVNLGNLVSAPWHNLTFDLTSWAGHVVRLRFEYWTGDSWVNDYFGWFLDDVAITSTSDPVTAFCTGDGGGGVCPCSNVGASGRGCPSSFNAQGALLSGSGVPSFTNDTLALTASDVSQSLVTFFAGPVRLTDGFSGQFGDGRRCVTGSVMRARAFPNPAGVAQIPLAGNPALGQAFNVTPTAPTRYVQALYRNAAGFCTSATFNLTNGVIVTWRP